MTKQNLNIISRKKSRILPPNVSFSGRKKTLYANMKETCELLKRDFEHLKEFLYTELGTTGSIDKHKRLIVKGRFRANQIQNVLRKYATQFVICVNCKSSDTELTKESSTRLYFLDCNSCHSRRSVNTIKSGYKAIMRGERRVARIALTQ